MIPDNLIYISIPRCATHTMHKIFDTQRAYNHMPLKHIYKVYEGDIKQAYKVVVVRNPFDHIESFYKYHKGLDYKFKGKELYNTRFDRWVTSGCRTHWKYYGHLVNDPFNQVGFITNDNNIGETHIDVDLIIKFEELSTSLKQHFNIDSNHIPKLNRSKKIDVEWSDRAIKFVQQKYKDQFKILGYNTHK